MGFPFSNSARGLQSILQLLDMGNQPRSLADELRLTVDALELYLLQVRERVNLSTVAAPAIGENYPALPIGIVPPGELWAVWSLQTQITCAAATSIELASCVNEQGFGYVVGDYLAVAAGQEGRCVSFNAYQGKPMWLPAGTRLGFQVKAITGAPGTAFVTALISRQRI